MTNLHVLVQRPRARPCLAVVPILCALLIAAGSPKPSDDLIRAGNEAYARGDIESAEGFYQQAEERAADPGLVAFNKGTVLFRRADFRRAELCFRRTLGDAEIPAGRRERALYNLGNCLVKQAGETDVKLLQTAIECYEMVLRETTDEGMRSDAGHNLEIAKLLWAKARARRPPGERDPDWDEPKDDRRPPPDPNKQDNVGSDSANEGPSKLESGAKLDMGKGKESGLIPKETEKAVPGQGNLPVLPDTGEIPQLSKEDAQSALKRAEKRLQDEREKLRKEAAQGERPRANDW